MSNEVAAIGGKLKLLRKKRGLTQDNIAELLGIETNYYATVENGHRNLALPKLIVLCKHYGITLNDLIDLSPQQNDDTQKDIWIQEICVILRKMSVDDIGKIKIALTSLTE